MVAAHAGLAEASPGEDNDPVGQRTDNHRGRYAVLVVCALLLLATAAVFGQTLDFGFVNFDDRTYVSENPHLAAGLTTETIGWAFTTDCCSNWHPLTWLSYLLDHQLYGLKPWGYHLSNVVLHGAAAVLLFLVLWRMTGDLWPSALVAAVFAVHPLRAESVAWISERKDVLSGLFFMLTLGAYAGYAGRPFSWARYLALVLLFALGLMAKPMLVTLPLVLLLLDFWPLGRIRLSAAAAALPRRVLAEKLPLLALSAASCAATWWAQQKAMSDFDALPSTSRAANAAVSCLTYVGQLFYPVKLAVFYPYPPHGYAVWQVAALLLLAGVTAGVVAYWRRFPWLPVGWFWYLGMLAPVIGLVQVGAQANADRYTYLPQIGLLIALVWSVKGVLQARPEHAWVAGVAAAVVVLALMACAWQQTTYCARQRDALDAHSGLHAAQRAGP